MSASMPYDKYCSLEELTALHDRALLLDPESGGQGVLDPGCPEATLGSAWSAAGYDDELSAEEPHLVFGSYVLYYFATKQCFVDANKRTGWLALVWVLAKLDLEVDATNQEAYDFVLGIANKAIPNPAAVVKWVSLRLRELQRLPHEAQTIAATDAVASNEDAQKPQHAELPSYGRRVDLD